ncbi:hypothetical protein [Oceanobacillus locisalsi]|uniref:Uncharacterized protein n=1 Tax=Oceanobacillus locisalsi TaxID=546107 RepID=A0ABW3NLB8_9BACI
MKKIITPIFIVIIALLLVSCEDRDEVADEIVNYYNEEWVPINDMKEKRMRNLLSEQERLESENKKEEAATLVKEEMVPIADKSFGASEGCGCR